MSSYPSFDVIHESTNLIIEDEVDMNNDSSRMLYQLGDLLKNVDESLQLLVVYQIIMFCLDYGYYQLAVQFYGEMTTSQNKDELPMGDPTCAFIHYALHKKDNKALAFCLSNKLYDEDAMDDIPFKLIEETFGITVKSNIDQ